MSRCRHRPGRSIGGLCRTRPGVQVCLKVLMTIVFFVHRIRPSVGGVEKYVWELSRALHAAGHSVTVVAGDHTGSLAASEVLDGITIRRFPAMRSPIRCRWHLLRMIGLFRRADVVSISNTHMLEYFWRTFGPLVEMRKLFLIRHGMSCHYPVPDFDKRRAVRSLDLVRGVIHDGRFIEKWLGVTPDLCPDQGLSPPAAELPPIPEPPPSTAAFVGRLEHDTGIRIYIEAVRLLVQEHGRLFRLDVYGDGSLLPSLREEVARQNLPVVFHGSTPHAQDKLSDVCFAFVDGRMVVQEAMARRRVVLAAYVNPLKRDYVCAESFGPYLFASGDARNLAATALYLIDRPEERHAAVERAFSHACGLTWTATAARFVNFWQERLSVPWMEPGPLRRIRLAALATEPVYDGEGQCDAALDRGAQSGPALTPHCHPIG